MSEPDFTPERMGRNAATFREANEQIAAKAIELEVRGPLPLICECADQACTAILRVTLDAYEAVRAKPTRFFNLPGHEAVARGHLRVVARTDAYLIVQKIGRAADVAAALDARRRNE